MDDKAPTTETPSLPTMAPCDVLATLKKAEKLALEAAYIVRDLNAVVADGRVRGGLDPAMAEAIDKAAKALLIGWSHTFCSKEELRKAQDAKKAEKAARKAAKAPKE
jgi:hypothetical protein